MYAPAITVIVPSYNYAHYLRGALLAAQQQSWRDFECLVVEDGSSDASLQVAQDFAATDQRFRVLTHADGKNHGLHASLALALAEAKGEWVAFLEADDLWAPQCLEQRMAVAVRSGAGLICNDISPMIMPGAEVDWFEGYVPRVMRWHAARQCGGVASTCTAGACTSSPCAASATKQAPCIVPPNGPSPCAASTGRIGGRNGGRIDGGPSPCTAPDVAPFLLENKIPTFSCAMVKTALLRGVSMQTPVSRWLDWWVWAQVAAQDSFAFCPEKLTQWRLHPDSWHHKVEMHSYIEDYRHMGQGFRRLFTKQLLQRKRFGVLAFLWLPASLRLFARLALTARGDGMQGLLRRIASRLEIVKSNRRF